MSNCQNTWRYDRRPGKDDNDFENKTEIESMKSVSSDIGEESILEASRPPDSRKSVRHRQVSRL